MKTSSIHVKVDSWNHLVARYTKPDTVLVNVNGGVKEQLTMDYSAGSYTENEGRITFGRGDDPDNTDEYFVGNLDEFRLWNYPLTDEQARSLYVTDGGIP